MKPPKKPRFTGDRDITRAAGMHDDLVSFEEYRDEIIPVLRQAVKSGMPPEKMREKFLTYLEAKKISMALLEPDTLKALAAIKDIQDRTEGKAIERKEHTHRYAKLSDDQVDAVLNSELQELDELSDVH